MSRKEKAIGFIKDKETAKFAEQLETNELLSDIKDNPSRVTIEKLNGFSDIAKAVKTLSSNLGGIETVKGKQGDKGEKGDKGERGFTGEKGDTGRDGLDGKDGKDGRDGRDANDVDHEAILDELEQNLPQFRDAFRDALETYDDEEEKLKISAIGNLEEKLKEIDGKAGQRIVTGSQRLFVEEEDGSPAVQTNKLKFANGSLTENADGSISVASGGGSGDVTASTNLGDNFLIRGDGATKGVQNSGITIDDSDNVTGMGTLNGRNLATDGSKLDGIEALADVTDTANVTSAGALMDSEVDADIKTLSLPASTTITSFAQTFLDDTTQGAVQTTLGVDPAGTDNSTDVTLVGTGTYLSLAGQAITVDPITESDISDLGAYITASSTDTLTNKSIDADTNTVTNIGFAEFDTDTSDTMKFVDGAFLDSPAVTVTSNGTTILLNFEKSGTGDIRIIFSTGVYIFDATPIATVSLTAGTDTVPVLNYVYILESTKALTVSTSGFPTAEHAPVATVVCQSATSLQTDGAYKVHAWTNHLSSAEMGMLSHINEWIRNQHATYVSGIASTFSGTGTATVGLATTAGVVLQLHDHTFPAFTDPADIYVKNHATAYTKITNIADIVLDSAGGSLTDRTYALVFWGSVNEVSGDCKIYCNIPAGSEKANKADKVREDKSKVIDYGIPDDFKGTGFLIYRLVIENVADTTWTLYTGGSGDDLRGQFPNTAAGSTAGIGSEFSDALFRVQDNTDPTKELAFEASGITTATVRTVTLQDASGTMALTSNKLSDFAATTSAELATAISDETGSGALTFANTPTLVTPEIGVATGTSLDLGGTTLLASRSLTVDTGGVFDINLGTASGDDFTIDTSAFVVEGDTGRVGVGITNPAYKLVVSNGGAEGLEINPGHASGVNLLQHYNRSGAAFVTARNSASDFEWQIGGATKMALDTSGRLGIGVASPVEELHVAGSGITRILIQDTNVNATGEHWALENNGGDFAIQQSTDATGAWNTVVDRIVILADGNVGVGASTPNQLLTVENSMSLKEIASANADTAAYGQIWVKSDTPNVLMFTDDAGTDTQLGAIASKTLAGKVELATTAEIDTGTDSTRAIPVDQFVASDRNIRFIAIRLIEAGTDVAVDTSVGGDWVSPFTGTLIQLDTDKGFFSAATDTAGTTGTMVVDVHKGGTTVMTTNKLDIETTEKSTITAATQPDLTTTAVTAGDVFTFDIDAIHTTAAKGLTVYMAIRMT